MKYYKIILAISITLFTLNSIAQEVLVSNINEYKKAIKEAKAGTTIVLKNGEWKDVTLEAYGKGTKESPIVIKAETPGEVFVTGDSRLKIYGEYVIVGGLWFKDGAATTKYVIEFRKNSKEFANNCRLTNTTVSYFGLKEGVDEKNHWVDIWGKNNRVDHCNFTGKRSEGTTLVVWLKGDEHVENNHLIDNNYFGKRPDLGKNGGETIRIGTSTNSMKSSKTTVKRNVFANCDGEIEIISNKSCDNIYTENLFLASQGSLTLRHGNNALVEKNVFVGNGVSKTGGIRIIGENHIVRNNYLIGLKGDGYRGPIVMMNGVPNSPLNRYFQVKNADVQNNTIIDCGPIVFGAGKDDEKSLAPINSVFANNVVVNSGNGNIYENGDSVTGISFSGNIVDSNSFSGDAYFKKGNVNLTTISSFPIPASDNAILKTARKLTNSPEKDITNQRRTEFVAGAFNLGGKRLPKALSLRAGTGWKPEIVAPALPVEKIIVLPGEDKLRKAISKANPGSIIYLKSGNYELEKTVKVAKDISIIGEEDGSSTIMSGKGLAKDLTYLFRVEPNTKLHLKNLVLDGSVGNVKYAIVSPDKNQGELYSFFADNVTFKNFTNTNGGSIFKAYNGTKADTIQIVNSALQDSYRGLNLSYDKDNMNMYNANVIYIKNTLFKNIEEHAVNYLRKTPNVILPGGKLVIENSVFSNVYNQEKGKILRTDGIHEVVITNSVFTDSYKIKTPISLKGSNNSISNSLLYDSGFVKLSNGAKKIDVLYKNPRWDNDDKFIPSKKSPLLKENNDKADIGLIQK